MEDNFYKASTERLISAPKKQQEKFQHDKIIFEKERPLVTAVIENLEENIAIRERIDSIKETNDPESFMREVAVNKQVCAILRKNLEYLKTKASMYDKKKQK